MTPEVSCNMSHAHGVERTNIHPAGQSQTRYKQLSQLQHMSDLGVAIGRDEKAEEVPGSASEERCACSL